MAKPRAGPKRLVQAQASRIRGSVVYNPNNSQRTNAGAPPRATARCRRSRRRRGPPPSSSTATCATTTTTWAGATATATTTGANSRPRSPASAPRYPTSAARSSRAPLLPSRRGPDSGAPSAPPNSSTSTTTPPGTRYLLLVPILLLGFRFGITSAALFRFQCGLAGRPWNRTLVGEPLYSRISGCVRWALGS